MELIFKLPDGLAVSRHLRVDAVGLLHHLVYNDFGISSYLEVLNPDLEGDLEPVELGLLVCGVV
jgi:hypothetical protein